jgi:hypothetical protein
VVMAVSRTFWSIENRSLQLWTWVVFNWYKHFTDSTHMCTSFRLSHHIAILSNPWHNALCRCRLTGGHGQTLTKARLFGFWPPLLSFPMAYMSYFASIPSPSENLPFALLYRPGLDARRSQSHVCGQFWHRGGYQLA